MNADVVLLATIALIRAASAATAGVTERSNAATATFSSYCLISTPDFSAQDQRATAAHLEVVEDRSIPMGNGEAFRQKNWLVSDPTGPFLLTSADVTHSGVHTIGCGIAVDGGNGADMARALSGDPRLGVPTKRVDPAPGGGVTVWWNASIHPFSPGEDAQVMMAYGVPGLNGPVVNFIYRTKVAP